MVKKGDANVLRYVVRALRLCAGMTQAAFGRASGIDQADISRFERGEDAPSEDMLRRMAQAAAVPWPLAVHLRRFFEAFTESVAEGAELPVDPERRLLGLARLAIAPYLLEEALVPEEQPPAEQRREAQEICAALRPFPAPQRRRLLAAPPAASRSPWLAVELCEESVRAAAHEPAAALDWVELALFVAGRVPWDESRLQRLKGYIEGFRANAWRVLEDYDAARDALALARRLWQAGAASAPDLLPEWRLLDLEASLRRAQRRFAEALQLLDRAFAACPGGEAAGRILLKRSATLEQMGDFAGSLAALAQAAPLLRETREPRLLKVLRFNTLVVLLHLERYAEAAALLPELRELTAKQGSAMDRLRLKWLEARVAAGLGQGEEALAGLEQVQRDFTNRKLPYDAALSSLDLAVLWLERGRRAAVRELAAGMAWIFTAKGIHREALAALRLFEEAARHDKATAGLARQVIAEVEKVRRTAPPIPKTGKT